MNQPRQLTPQETFFVGGETDSVYQQSIRTSGARVKAAPARTDGARS